MSLYRIQNTVQEVAEAISVVLDVEVTIINDEYKRVAATGKYKELIGKRIPSNSVFEKVIKDKVPKCTCSSYEDEECKKCSAKKECTELAAIGYPIIDRGNLLGIIGINAFKEDQKRNLIENKDCLMTFLDKISGLLAVNFSYFETIEKLQIQSEEMKKIIDSSIRGIVCVDNDGEIKFFNKRAGLILNINKECNNIKQIIKNYDISAGERKYQEIKVTTDKKKSSIIIKSEPVILENEKVSTIMEVNKTADAVKEAYNLLEVNKHVSFDDIIGESAKINIVKEIARRVARNESTVLIRGESGTGKELFARAIHSTSLRCHAPFIAINCASIPENLLESELFGYEGGAFTGARKEGQMGKFELASGGTIFLDEIGDMPLHLQPKILRVLQERSFTKVGGKEPINVDIRLVAATHRNLEEMIMNGQFREDLFYRLNVIPINLPNLKDRGEDVLLLSEKFLKKYCNKLETELKQFSAELKKFLLTYSWPGNIRELENVIEYLINISRGKMITVDELPPAMKEGIRYLPDKVLEMSLKNQVERFEKSLLISMMKSYGKDTESKIKIAEELDINLSTLYRKLSKYNLLNF